MEHKNWTCPKCSNRSFETDTVAMTGSGLSRFFDIQNRKFAAINCTRCGYTEFYKMNKAGTLSNLLDLITT
ncbi:MAG: zinc ribbon domain-containing protein [Bacteroidota bacterium]|nr:zinc ribbon domain-containing protein [Bacteroidota bacterium]